MKCKQLVCLLTAAALLLTGCAADTASVSEASAASDASAASSAVSDIPTLPGQNTTPAPETVQETAAPGWTPQKDVTLIVAYKEGSSTDIGARLLAQYAQQYIGQTVTIQNIASNAGMAGWEALAAANPDGYTLGFINMPNIFTAMENGGNFTTQSFEPVCSHVVETSVVVVPENSPWQTLDDLITANRTASDAGSLLRAATNGVQASNDIGAALLAYTSGGWRFRHVSYGSTGDQIGALLSGECDWGVAKVSDIMPYLAEDDPALTGDLVESSGEMPTLNTEIFAESEATSEAEADTDATDEESDEIEAESLPTAPSDAHIDLGTSEHLRVLGLFGTERAAELPGLATMGELGYPTGWYGSTRAIVAPAGTDANIIAFYAEAFRKAMEDPDCVQAHTEAGYSLYYLAPTELAERIDERERFNHTLLPRLFAS